MKVAELYEQLSHVPAGALVTIENRLGWREALISTVATTDDGETFIVLSDGETELTKCATYQTQGTAPLGYRNLMLKKLWETPDYGQSAPAPKPINPHEVVNTFYRYGLKRAAEFWKVEADEIMEWQDLGYGEYDNVLAEESVDDEVS